MIRYIAHMTNIGNWAIVLKRVKVEEDYHDKRINFFSFKQL